MTELAQPAKNPAPPLSARETSLDEERPVTVQNPGTMPSRTEIAAPEAQAVAQRKRATRKARRAPGYPWPTRLALRLIVPAVILLGWWWLSTLTQIGLFVVSPVTAFHRFFTEFFSTDAARAFLGQATYHDLFPSVGRALAGFGIAVVVGVVVGVVLGISRVLTGLFQPLVHLGRSLPSPALLGVFFFLFGVGDSPKVFLIAFSIVWPILLNTIDGVSSIGAVRAQAAQVFRIPSRDVLFHIILPGASPKIFAGMRTSLSFSLILMIISELQKSANGLGYLLVQSQRDFNYASFWAVLVMLVILGVLFNLIFLSIERRVLAWHRGATAQHD